jgi:hypothetical protein
MLTKNGGLVVRKSILNADWKLNDIQKGEDLKIRQERVREMDPPSNGGKSYFQEHNTS